MALLTFNPPVGPSPGTAFTPTIKLLEAEFGDGFSQTTPDGINHIRDGVELKWDGLTEAEMLEIYQFFTDHKGSDVFYYKPAGYVSPGKWQCKEWSRALNAGVWGMKAVLKQSFSLSV